MSIDITKKEDHIKAIIEEVLNLDDPPLEKNRKDKLLEFIKFTINGDTPENHLVFNANLKNKESGIMIYVVTNAKLIRIEVDSKEMQSSSFLLEQIYKVERKLLDDGHFEIKIYFQNESFTLQYGSEDIKIPDFFQKLDQLRLRNK